MAEDSMADRLRGHADAFDGLMSLIPADIYYGKGDTSDQWKKKKQTKEQAAAAQRAKLDPDSAKSAKDVMDERARKRKLEELEESDLDGFEKEVPMQGMKTAQDRKKKQKTAADAGSAKPSESSTSKDEKRRLKAERKKQEVEKKAAKKAKKTQKALNAKEPKASDEQTELLSNKAPAEESILEDVAGSDAADEADNAVGEMSHFEAEGLEAAPEDHETTTSQTSAPPSPLFDNPSEPSTNTSTSSVIPPATAPKHIKLPKVDPEIVRARLAAKIEALRAARKADGPDGKPARNRQELLEARRKKEQQRQAHKKELRMKQREQEEALREAALASARDSPASSMMSPAIRSPDHNFSFGRVAFADGQQLSDNLSTLLEAPKKRGPQDPATALQASEKKRLRIAGFDDEKRADIEEKDLWLNAKKRAHGEKIRDDSSLLKKTLKRKEKAKKKSEKEWGERKEGVAKSQAMKQKKREENLQKRRDEKGSKGKGKGKAVHKKKPKVKSRPGFEGSFGSGGKRK